jgi:hypothetical protein
MHHNPQQDSIAVDKAAKSFILKLSLHLRPLKKYVCPLGIKARRSLIFTGKTIEMYVSPCHKLS